MVWLSDPTLNAIDEQLSLEREQALANLNAPAAPSYTPDYAAQDASMLGAFSRPTVYEDGSLSDGGSYVDAGYSNPWTTPAPDWSIDTSYFDYTTPGDAFTAPPGYTSPNVIDMRGANDPWTDWGAQDAAYFDTQGPTYEVPNLSPYGPPDPNPWQPEIDESYFQTQPAPVYDFGAQEDQSYFEGPSSQQVLGDWIYKYQDWGGTQDQAYFDTVSSPENPQDAAQKFLYNPPKIDPANLGSAGTPIWDAIDNTILKPLDFASEIGGDWTPNLLRTLPMTAPSTLLYDAVSYGANALGANLPTLNNPLEVTQRTGENFTDYEGAVSDFRDRPVWQQLLYGTVYDPTAFIPGLGASDEVGGAIKSAWTAARGNADELLQNPGLRSLAGTLDDELGTIQVGRTTPLKVGDVVRDAAGAEWTVAKNFDGTINGWVNVVDETTETGVKKIKRGMLDAGPVGDSVMDEAAAISPTPVRDVNGLVVDSPEWEQDVLSRSNLWASRMSSGSEYVLPTPELEETQRVFKAVINDRTLTGPARTDALDAAREAAEQALTDAKKAYRDQLRTKVLSQAREQAMKNAPPLTAAGDLLPDVTKMVPEPPVAANRGATAASQIQEGVRSAANPETYFNGDRARYLTTTPDKDGFYELEMLEGTKKGQVRVTRTAPDGSDPRFGEFQSQWQREQEGWRRLKNAQNQSGNPTNKVSDIGAATPPPRVPPTDVGPIDVDGARNKLLEALRKESNIRRTGTADREIAEGRARQAAGIRDRLAQGRAQGLTGEALTDYARGGMKTGPLRKTVAPALDLAPAERTALIQELTDTWKGGDFDLVTAAKATQKMLNGEGVQPRELKMLREAFGDEVAEVVSSRPKVSRIVEAQRDAAEARKIDAMAERQLRNAQNEAATWERRLQDLYRSNQETADRAAMRVKWKAIGRQNDAEEIRTMLANPFLTAEERAIASKQITATANQAQRAAGRATDAIWDSAKKANPDAEDLRRQALAIIKEKTDNPELAEQLEKSVAVWLDSNRAVLDAIGETRVQAWAKFQASLTGDVSDSFVTSLLRREEDLSAALKLEGLDEDVANKVARTLRDREVTLRYSTLRNGQPTEVPPAVLRALEEAKNNPLASSQGIAGALGTTSQFLKNSMFWADFSVAGQQLLKSVITSGPQMFVGMANRAAASMNLPSITTNLAGTNGVSKRVAYQLDGVMQGTRTGAVDLDRTGSVFSKIPGVGKAADWLTEKQFGTVLTGVRNAIYEGNLITAKLVGQDITDPRVRAAAANYANIATSAGGRALDARRADWERALLLSPQFTRAQVKQIVRLSDLIRPGASITERALAATTIASTAAIGLGAGKWLNDQYGIGEFEMDPSKPGFGRITFPGGRVVDIFPQDQLVTAIARSARELSSMDREGLQNAQDVWTRFALGRISPPLQMAAKGGGYGFDAEDGGWKLGDYKGSLLDIAPLPPGFVQIWREGLDAAGTPLNTLGISNYQESDFQAFDRKVKNDPEFGKSYYDLEEAQRKAADERYGKPLSRDPEIAEQQTIAQEIKDANTKGQQDSDRWVTAGEKDDGTPYTPEDWRDDRKRRNEILSAQFDVLYRDMPPKKEADKTPVDRYYDAIKAAETNGVVDWDAVDAYMAALPPADQEYIARNTGLSDTPLEREYRADVAKIGDSGYFDLTEGKREFRQANPEIAELVRKWGYSPTSVAAEDLTNRYADMQKVDDEALAANSITPEEWRTNYRSRMDELRAGKDVLYAGLEEDGESTKPLDQWFAQIEAATAANGQDVDWDKVDAWIAAQPADVQATIDGYTGTALTPLVAEYRADVKVIADSGYWDVRDQVFDYWIQSLGMESGIIKEDEYFDLVRQAYVGYAEEYLDANSPGWRAANPQAAVLMAQVPLNSLESKFQSGVTKANASFREQAPEVAWLIRKWGYGGTGKEELGKALATP